MSNASDFVIENGVLKKYVGPGGDVVIPDGVTVVGAYSFLGPVSAELTSVVIPNGVTEISTYAFSEQMSLASVVIPESVTNICKGAFKSCVGLAEIRIPESVVFIDSEAFLNCSSLTEITLPERLTEICSYTFSECTGLKSVIIPTGVQTIREGAFSGCSKLTSFSIPAGVKEIEAKTFENCKKLSVVSIPESIVNIGHHAFSGCRRLFSVTIQKGVRKIGDYAFSDTGVTELDLPHSLRAIGDHAFSNCKKLKSVSIPGSVTTIAKSSFENCDSLTFAAYQSEKYLGDPKNPYRILISSDKEIKRPFNPYYAYYPDGWDCVVHPDTKIIADCALDGCYGIQSLVLPEGLLEIGEFAFACCTVDGKFRDHMPVSFGIPFSVRRIAAFAFYNCAGLKTVTILNPKTRIGQKAFEDCDDLTIRAVAGSVAEKYAKKNHVAFEAI